MDALGGTLFSDRFLATLPESDAWGRTEPPPGAREAVAASVERASFEDQDAVRERVASVLNALDARDANDGEADATNDRDDFSVEVVAGPLDERRTVETHAELGTDAETGTDAGTGAGTETGTGAERGDASPRSAPDRTVLTNGRRWRLLVADEPADRFLEVNLSAALSEDAAFGVFARCFGPAFGRIRDAHVEYVADQRTALEATIRQAVGEVASDEEASAGEAPDGEGLDGDELDGEASAEDGAGEDEVGFDAACALVFRLAVGQLASARGREVRRGQAVADARTLARWEGDLPFGTDPALARPDPDDVAGETLDRVVARFSDAEIDWAALDARHLGDAYERLLDGAVDDRRTTTGAYYTPEYVVRYAVETTLDAPDATVLDPAMGSGHFLVAAVEHLAELRVRRGTPLARARREVAEECVFGVDVDPLAVELARAGVWLRTGAWPDDHLRTADALFDYSLNDGAFDAVVGNPPYVRSRSVPADRKRALRDRYDTARGAFDLYVPFLERMAELGERVCAIVPNKWTTARYGRTLRDRLLDRHALDEIVDVSDLPVFADADVYPVVVSLRADAGATDDFRIRQVEAEGSATRSISSASPDLRVGRETTLSRSFVGDLGNRVIPVGIDPAFVPIARRVRRECDRLGDHVTLTEGIHTGNVRDELVTDAPDEFGEADGSGESGDPDDCAEHDCSDDFGDYERVVGGGEVSRYRVEWDGEWIRFDESIVKSEGAYGDLRDRETFECEKLLIRDISDRPVAAYDDEGLFALNTLYSVRNRPESDLPLRHVLAVVNSAFAATYFQQVYGGTHVNGGYLRCKPMFAANLPVPSRRGLARPTPADGERVDRQRRDELADLAGRMADLRRERAAVTLSLPDPTGPRLGDLDHRVPGDESMLAETTTDRSGLRVGRVVVGDALAERVTGAVDAGEPDIDEWNAGEPGASGSMEGRPRRDDDPVVAATARYRPDGPDRATDEWGFAESDPIPALSFDVDDERSDLLRAFVSRAAETEAFRPRAGKTISLLDRLREIRLPRLDDAREFLADWRRAAELDAEIAATDAEIDRLVCRAAKLDDDEIAVVKRLVE